jgi:lysophospholipase L1-like esterase
LVLVNANAILAQLATTGASINGSALTASISPPFGAFSLDGVHPNARGHAYIANKFIEAINAKFGSSIPLCNPNDYPGNELPVP